MHTYVKMAEEIHQAAADGFITLETFEKKIVQKIRQPGNVWLSSEEMLILSTIHERVEDGE